VTSGDRGPRLFGLSNGVGFTSVLLGDVPVSNALPAVDGMERLKLVVSGPIPPNPSELLLAGRRAVEALAAPTGRGRRGADRLAYGPAGDRWGRAGQCVDGTLPVALAGKTTHRKLHWAHEILRQVDARLPRTVLIGVAGDAAYGYSYRYQPP